ncbi:ComEC/Rec2 family competence protein [Patescibacteria group bacterium]|nr:ComEC/Rec2 family competence protein [Patescibacteria group bacterium]
MREKIFKFFYQYKLQFTLAGFCLGIFLHSCFALNTLTSNITIVLATLLFLLWLIILRFKKIKPFLYAFIAIILGVWRFDIAIPANINTATQDCIQARVISVTRSDYNYRIRLKVQDENYLRVNSIITAYIGRNPPIGSLIEFTCIPKIFADDDQSAYEKARFFHYSQANCSIKEYKIIKQPNIFDIRQKLFDWRNFLTRRIQGALPGDYGILAAGILYGERGMSDQADETFRKAGLTHIIAVSGSNITILVNIVFIVFMGLGLYRRQAFWLTIAAIIFFVAFVGFSASVVRAAIMGSLVLLSRHLGRLTNVWHLMLVSAAMLCLIDPWLLMFDAGFALSFLATLGLIAWTPLFQKFFNFLPKNFGIQEVVTTTLAANIMTIPYIAFIFSRMSLAGLITNLVVVPIVPYAMLFSGLAAIAGPNFLKPFSAMPAYGIMKIIFFASDIAEVFPWLDIHIKESNAYFLFATYAILIKIWFTLSKKSSLSTRKEKICLSVIDKSTY